MERMEESDADALAQARAGDSDGFRTLVERHRRGMFRLAYSMTSNEQDAEDVVQEAFLRAFRRLDQYDARARFSSWLFRITANCAPGTASSTPGHGQEQRLVILVLGEGRHVADDG